MKTKWHWENVKAEIETMKQHQDFFEFVMKRYFEILKVPKKYLYVDIGQPAQPAKPRKPGPKWRPTQELLDYHKIPPTLYGYTMEERKKYLNEEETKRQAQTKTELKCECGGETANTSHSDWCPRYVR